MDELKFDYDKKTHEEDKLKNKFLKYMKNNNLLDINTYDKFMKSDVLEFIKKGFNNNYYDYTKLVVFSLKKLLSEKDKMLTGVLNLLCARVCAKKITTNLSSKSVKDDLVNAKKYYTNAYELGVKDAKCEYMELLCKTQEIDEIYKEKMCNDECKENNIAIAQEYYSVDKMFESAYRAINNRRPLVAYYDNLDKAFETYNLAYDYSNVARISVGLIQIIGGNFKEGIRIISNNIDEYENMVLVNKDLLFKDESDMLCKRLELLKEIVRKKYNR